jgi:hypothetical protein
VAGSIVSLLANIYAIALTDGLFQGKTQVIDADLSKYLDVVSYCPPIHGDGLSGSKRALSR